MESVQLSQPECPENAKLAPIGGYKSPLLNFSGFSVRAMSLKVPETTLTRAGVRLFHYISSRYKVLDLKIHVLYLYT